MTIKRTPPASIALEKFKPSPIAALLRACDLNPVDVSRVLKVSDALVSHWMVGRRHPDNPTTYILTRICAKSIEESEAFYRQPGIDSFIKEAHAKAGRPMNPNWRWVVETNISEAKRLLQKQNELNEARCKESDYSLAFERLVELGCIPDEQRVDLLRRYLNPATRLAAVNELVFSGDLDKEGEAKAREQLSKNGIEAMPSKKASPKKQSKKSAG